MSAALEHPLTAAAQDREIAATVQRERGRLLAFIRRRIADAAEAEDVLQDALYELVLAYRMMQPVEQARAWLTRVARNRIIDRFRSRSREPRAVSRAAAGEELDDSTFEDLLPAPDSGPEAAFMRELLLEEIQTALEELPREQREVFVAHELEGRSFKDLAAESGVNVNTLLARKRYAVLHLRERLQDIHDEFFKR